MGDITELLQAARKGDADSLDAVFNSVYPQLRALAGSRLQSLPPNQTLSATALVHETYLKLTQGADLELADRHHFYACAACAMRQILVDHARAKASAKRGGDKVFCTWKDIGDEQLDVPDLLEVDAALERLGEVDSGLRQLVEMRIFAGMTLQQLAETSNRSVRSINRDWQRARALLLAQMP